MSGIHCNFYKMTSNPYNVVITADMWDHDGATRTHGTIEIDGKVVEWSLGEPTSTDEGSITPIVIEGKNKTHDDALAAEILDALAERHCPETSDGRMGADHREEGCCPVCAAKHELAVYDVTQTLRKQGVRTRNRVSRVEC